MTNTVTARQRGRQTNVQADGNSETDGQDRQRDIYRHTDSYKQNFYAHGE